MKCKTLGLVIVLTHMFLRVMSQGYVPDPSFGVNGIIHNDSTRAKCATKDAAGNFYIGGYRYIPNTNHLSITKLLPNGNKDLSFGVNGISSFDMTPLNGSQTIYGLAIQPDGKIIFVGEAYFSATGFDGIIGRLTATGQFDSTFNGVGYRLIDVNMQYDAFSSVAIQNDGKLVVGGYSCFGGTYDYKFAAWRFHSNGSTDLTFANMGLYRHNLNGNVYKVLLDGSDIVLGGYINATSADYYIVRLDMNGDPDTQFGSNGEFIHTVSNSNVIVDLIKDGTGYLAYGDNYTGNPVVNDRKPQVFRVTGTGQLDITMFNSGFHTFSLAGFSVWPTVMLKSGNTLILGGSGYVTGSATSSRNSAFYQVDLNTGSLITTNGVNGLVQFGIAGVEEFVEYFWEDPNGKLVIIGSENVDNYIARYVNSSVGIPETGEPGISLFPNPSSESLHVTVPLQGISVLEITDVSGKVLKTHKVVEGNNIIDINYIAPGIYFVNVYYDQSFKYSSRLVIRE